MQVMNQVNLGLAGGTHPAARSGLMVHGLVYINHFDGSIWQHLGHLTLWLVEEKGNCQQCHNRRRSDGQKENLRTYK